MIGEVCALGAALTWSIGLLLFKKSEAVSPQAMNLFKNTAALGLLLLTMLAFGVGFDLSRPLAHWGLLAASGILGIAVADTMTFMALRRLGPALLAVVECSYAPTLVLLSVLLLGERLTPGFLVGGILVVVGVLVATAERSKRKALAHPDDGRERSIGVALGIAGILTMGLGVMVMKPILEHGSLIEVTAVRLAAGVAGQLVWMIFVPSAREALTVFRNHRVQRTLLPASFLGSYLAMLMWLGGFKWTTASTASVLNQTSTVFTVVLARIFLAEPVTLWRALGVGTAMAGAMLVLAGGAA